MPAAPPQTGVVTEGFEVAGPELSDGPLGSAGTTPREAALQQQSYSYLRQWIQSEEERLGGHRL